MGDSRVSTGKARPTIKTVHTRLTGRTGFAIRAG
jgi:hypothetical protein